MGAPFQILDPVISLQASTDLSASQFCAMTMNSSQQLLLPSANSTILGVLQNNPNAAGKAAELQIRGVTKAKLGGTVNVGDTVKVDSSGRFLTASAGDIAAGFAVGMCIVGGAINNIGSVSLDLAGTGFVAASGFDDIVLGTTAPSGLTLVTFVQTTGTKTGVLPNGVSTGQTKRFVQSVAASTPVGTVTGTFKDQTGAAKTTLALGTAVATIADFIWDGAAWRLTSAVTGTGSSLS